MDVAMTAAMFGPQKQRRITQCGHKVQAGENCIQHEPDPPAVASLKATNGIVMHNDSLGILAW
jgi:hypothetical protein